MLWLFAINARIDAAHPKPGFQRKDPVSTEPTNQEVAAVVGIDEYQVDKYRTETLQLGDGSWLVSFSYLMPRELRHSFTGSFTVVIAKKAYPQDARRNR
ncbi:hypothetical protein [Pseudomonas putida]|uniref:hypothetical protein n=1 Tax=Pseudomonas putida TaxID=303 RepID=UPI001FB6EB28|nr:hypothetical protein [Pseudomonas putida]